MIVILKHYTIVSTDLTYAIDVLIKDGMDVLSHEVADVAGVVR